MSADPPRPPETLAPLRELAEKATPGPWLIDDTKRAFEEWRVEHEHDGLIAFCDGRRNLHASVNAAYIAAVSPVVVLALLRQIELLSAARDALRDGLARNGERAQKAEAELDAQRAALATVTQHLQIVGNACGFPVVDDLAQLTETICKAIARSRKEREQAEADLATARAALARVEGLARSWSKSNPAFMTASRELSAVLTADAAARSGKE